MTVYRHGLQKGVRAYILKIGERTMHIILCIKAIFSGLNLKPNEDFYATA